MRCRYEGKRLPTTALLSHASLPFSAQSKRHMSASSVWDVDDGDDDGDSHIEYDRSFDEVRSVGGVNNGGVRTGSR